MKKNQLLFALLLLAISSLIPLKSQAQEPVKLNLGIKAGANFGKTEGAHLNTDFKGHFLGGIFVGLQFTNIRIQAEALFSQSTITTGKGFKDAFQNYISQNGVALKNGTFDMDQLSVPILFGVNVFPKFLWLEAGPQYTATISLKDESDFVNDVETVVKKGYVSGVVGVEIHLPLHLNVGARYVFGLSDRNNTDIGDSWKTTQIEATIGFNFL